MNPVDGHITVMVSSTMDLPAERAAAIQAVQELGLQSWALENPPAQFATLTPRQFSVEMARTCDIYILILGSRYGFVPDEPPDGDPRSATHLEYDSACSDSSRKVLVFATTAALSTPDTAQEAFVHEVSEFDTGHTRYPAAATASDMKTQILEALVEWMQRSDIGLVRYLKSVRDQFATFPDPVLGIQRSYETMVGVQLRYEQATGMDRRAWDEADVRLRGLVRFVGQFGKVVPPQVSDFLNRVIAQAKLRGVLRSPEEFEQRHYAQPSAHIDEPDTIVRQFRRLILLGDPGAGKSTLLRQLTFETAHVTLHANFSPQAEQQFIEPQVPVYLLAQQLDDIIVSFPHMTLKDCLIIAVAGSLATESALALDHMFHRGSLLFLLEGFDQLHGQASRDRVVAALDAMGLNYCVVALRPASWREDLSPGWQVCEIQQLDDSRRKSLISSVFRAVAEQSGISKSSTDPSGLLKLLDDRDDLRIWSGNPLLLTLLSAMYARDGELPTSRSAIYRRALDGIWETRRTPADAADFQIDKAEKFLQMLALYMMRQGMTLLRQQEMEAFRASSGLGVSVASLDVILARAGVIQAQGTDRWGFIHLTFQEYLAAAELSAWKRHDMLNLVRAKRLSSQWEQTILLLVDELDRLNRHAASDAAINTLVDADHRRVGVLGCPDPTHRSLVLAARCQSVRNQQGFTRLKKRIDDQLSWILDPPGLLNPSSTTIERILNAFNVKPPDIVPPQRGLLAARRALQYAGIGIPAFVAVIDLVNSWLSPPSLPAAAMAEPYLPTLVLVSLVFIAIWRISQIVLPEDVPVDASPRSSISSELASTVTPQSSSDSAPPLRLQFLVEQLRQLGEKPHVLLDDSIISVFVRGLFGLTASADQRAFLDVKRRLMSYGPAAAPVVPELMACLHQSNSPVVRASAAQILFRMGSVAQPAATALENALHDRNSWVACYCAGALGQQRALSESAIGSLAAIEQLLIATATQPTTATYFISSEDTRQAALFALARLSGRSRKARSVLIRCLAQPDSTLAAQAEEAITFQPTVSPLLLRRMANVASRSEWEKLAYLALGIAMIMLELLSLLTIAIAQLFELPRSWQSAVLQHLSGRVFGVVTQLGVWLRPVNNLWGLAMLLGIVISAGYLLYEGLDRISNRHLELRRRCVTVLVSLIGSITDA